MESALKPVVLEALKTLGRKLREKGLPSVEWLAEFRGLVEEGRKLEDLGKVERLLEEVDGLRKRVLEVENRMNLAKVQKEAAAMQSRTPRIMG